VYRRKQRSKGKERFDSDKSDVRTERGWVLHFVKGRIRDGVSGGVNREYKSCKSV